MTTLNLHLGEYKNEEIHVFGGGFDKVNLITGMKGGGKSHIAKGIISENIKANMSAIIFDINGEYDSMPDCLVLKPGENLKFRLDFLAAPALFEIFSRLAPLPERTFYPVYAKLPQQIEDRKNTRTCPDIEYLSNRTNIDGVFGNSKDKAVEMMRSAYERSLDILDSYSLFMTEGEARQEDEFISGKGPNKPSVISLRSAFKDMFDATPQILVFQLGGLNNVLQKSIVSLVLDHLKSTCDKQSNSESVKIPVYPTVFFEEAHMYMDAKEIDNLIPIIRHIGINLFFITNTPGALPDSVFRLIDNLIMTRMLNRKDIDRVADCGLVDKETIVGFAQNLKEHHALFLSAKTGATKGFPLVFKVRDFDLPKSGETRSQWTAMKKAKESDEAAEEVAPEASPSKPSRKQKKTEQTS